MELKGTEIQLYPHQIESIKNMEALEATKTINKNETKLITKFGINSDLTGFGKTISMIGLIVRDKMEWDLQKKYEEEETIIYNSNMFKKTKNYFYNRINTTLILVSPSILRQWLNELSKTNLKVCSIITNLKANTVNANEYDVIITVPNFIRPFVYRYIDCAFKRFIYDEPSNVPIPEGVYVKAGFTWFLTATPELISTFQRRRRNSLMKNISNDLYYVMNMVCIKNNDEFIKASFTMPETIYTDYICYNNVFKILNNVVDDRIKKIIETGNISEAILQLGGHSTSNILEVVSNNNLIELKNINTRIELWEMKNDIEKIGEWKMKREHILKKMKDLETRIKSVLNNKCCICFEDLNKPVMEPNCQNIFCGSCLLNWFKTKRNCPLCRVEIDTTKLIYIQRENEKKEEIKEPLRNPTKEEIILKLIQTSQYGKFIIYSDDEYSFNKIRDFLKSNNISYFELKGGSNTRYKSIQKFKNQKNEKYIAFLNSIKNCSGINLQETTDIIFYHPVNENIRTQVIGRANRIGRLEQLNVHQLLLEQ